MANPNEVAVNDLVRLDHDKPGSSDPCMETGLCLGVVIMVDTIEQAILVRWSSLCMRHETIDAPEAKHLHGRRGASRDTEWFPDTCVVPVGDDPRQPTKAAPSLPPKAKTDITELPGAFVMFGHFIALRGNNEHMWRLSKIRLVHGASPTSGLDDMALTYVDSFTHLWQCREYATEHQYD